MLKLDESVLNENQRLNTNTSYKPRGLNINSKKAFAVNGLQVLNLVKQML